MNNFVSHLTSLISDSVETRGCTALFRGSRVVLAFVVSVVLLVTTGSAQEYRTWTSSNGKHTFDAELISYKDGELTLKGKDGKVKSLDPSQLSDGDRKFLESVKEVAGAKLTKDQKERLKKLGLKLSRDEFSLLDERKLKMEISKSLKQKKELIGMSVSLGQLRIAQLNAESRIVALKQEDVQLNAKMANTTAPRESNRLIGLINANRSAMQLLQKDINSLDKKISERQSFMNKASEEFVQYVLDIREFSDSLDEKGKQLNGADEFVDLLAEIESTLGRSMKPIGESRTLARMRANLSKLESVVMTDTIPLQNNGSGTFKAAVSLNGQEAIELVVDSGASLVTVPARLAAQLKIDVGPNARPIRMTIADGSTISGKLVILDSVRMGKFVATNVECAVLGPEAVNAPNLLGMSFLGNFKFELDAAKSELKMMTVETEE